MSKIVIKKILFELVKKMNFFRLHCWSIYIGKGRIRDAALWRSIEIKPHRGTFWADPFLFEKSGKLYIEVYYCGCNMFGVSSSDTHELVFKAFIYI